MCRNLRFVPALRKDDAPINQALTFSRKSVSSRANFRTAVLECANPLILSLRLARKDRNIFFKDSDLLSETIYVRTVFRNLITYITHQGLWPPDATFGSVK